MISEFCHNVKTVLEQKNVEYPILNIQNLRATGLETCNFEL